MHLDLTLSQLNDELLRCASTLSPSTQKSLSMPFIATRCRLLATDIFQLNYQPKPYTRFAVTDPKPREIYAPALEDRLAQAWLVSQLNSRVERQLIEDTYANRKGKGSLRAVKRAQQFSRQPNHSHFLQLDIQNYFNSIYHPTLLTLLNQLIARYPFTQTRQACITQLMTRIISQNIAHSSYAVSGSAQLLKTIPAHKCLLNAPHETGLPLGSVASQLFANLYLSPFDQFVKHTLKVKGYVRYMDDVILFSDSTQQLNTWKAQISHFLHHTLHLTLHPTKQHLQHCPQGADYLGYKIYPHYLHLRTRNIKKLIHWLRIFNYGFAPSGPAPKTDHPVWAPLLASIQPNAHTKQPWDANYPLLQKIQAVLNSYLGLMKHANHYRLRKQLYHRHFNHLTRWLIPADANYASVKIKKYVLRDWLKTQTG